MSSTSLPVSFVDEGLGNSSYLVDLGDGGGLVIDPARHPGGYLGEAKRRGLELKFAAETHLHADFVSGARELGALGARVLAPGAGEYGFAVKGLRDGDEVDLGGLTLQALATPGHTPEHLAYLLMDGSDPIALFSGGSLLVGAVARTDLIDPEQTDALARELWRSLHRRILTLPDDLPVFPTHGGGSFCSTTAGNDRTTTIGRERGANPLLVAPDEDAFVTRLLATFASYPPYFRRMRDINRRGPQLYGPAEPLMPSLGPRDVAALQVAGAWVIDARPPEDFARAHVPGSVSIALRPQFATWLGWIVPEGAAMVFVLGHGQDRTDLIRQARNVGYETLLGELAGGISAWQGTGRDVASIPLAHADCVVGTVVDVRQHAEFAGGHLPHARNIELGSLAAGAVPNGPVAVMCGHGERAMTAASLLTRSGRREVIAVTGGPQEWSQRYGPLVTGT